jgi:lipopolysaccharide/colanic/teichoic acid biosynthesis glycosyltransferase
MMKRSMDIGGSLAGLLLLILLLPFIALFILWEDRGPIFYKQERIGLYGRPFRTYKLRSMITNADAYLAQHPELLQSWRQSGKLRDDPRITRIGKFLRRTSLDELPQVLNVLRGEMSLVGPRAIQAAEVRAFDELAELRQMVKPGLTGLWQISGRSHTSYGQRALLDCTYVLECSIAVDLSILIRTLPVVLRGEGAY